MDIPPVDPRLNAKEITELSLLNTSEVTIAIPKITKADSYSLVVSSDHVIIEEMDYSNVPMTNAFCVGDCILKVNEEAPQSSDHFKKIMADLSPCTVVVSRRSYVTAPGEQRLRKSLINMGLPYQKGFTYQVITCKKQEWDRFVTTSFGFLADDITVPQVNTNKFVIGEIITNTAAEKYFSVGDGIIDFRGWPVKPKGDPVALKQFIDHFRMGMEFDVLIERPVTKDARTHTEQFIKRHLIRHDTPPMNEDAMNIGVHAALYHNMFWRKMTPVGILVRPPPVTPGTPRKKWTSRKKKTALNRLSKRLRVPMNGTVADEKGSGQRNSKKRQTEATAYEGTEKDGEGDDKHITIERRKNYQEILTDVSQGTELETVGYRYSDGEDDEDDKEDVEDSRKRARAAKRAKELMNWNGPGSHGMGPIKVPYVRKTGSKKSKPGLFSAVFNRLKK